VRRGPVAGLRLLPFAAGAVEGGGERMNSLQCARVSPGRQRVAHAWQVWRVWRVWSGRSSMPQSNNRRGANAHAHTPDNATACETCARARAGARVRGKSERAAAHLWGLSLAGSSSAADASAVLPGLAVSE
jgi:hypothetical protein